MPFYSCNNIPTCLSFLNILVLISRLSLHHLLLFFLSSFPILPFIFPLMSSPVLITSLSSSIPYANWLWSLDYTHLFNTVQSLMSHLAFIFFLFLLLHIIILISLVTSLLLSSAHPPWIPSRIHQSQRCTKWKKKALPSVSSSLFHLLMNQANRLLGVRRALSVYHSSWVSALLAPNTRNVKIISSICHSNFTHAPFSVFPIAPTNACAV